MCKVSMRCNEIVFGVWEAKWCIGLKVYRDGIKLVDILKWRSAVASVG